MKLKLLPHSPGPTADSKSWFLAAYFESIAISNPFQIRKAVQPQVVHRFQKSIAKKVKQS